MSFWKRNEARGQKPVTDLIVHQDMAPAARQQSQLFDMGPKAQAAYAAEVATVLKDIIDKQKLYSMIQGKKYVRLEGWVTLGSMLGVMPREKEARELDDGSWEAVVELYNIRTGMVVGQGSALCGVDEKRWANAERYARKSMAVTRATGKAYRLGFSWIMTMAGYETTPAEEMPQDYRAPQTARPAPQPPTFDKNNHEHVQRLEQKLRTDNVDAVLHMAVVDILHGKLMNMHQLNGAILQAKTTAAFDHIDAELEEIPFE